MKYGDSECRLFGFYPVPYLTPRLGTGSEEKWVRVCGGGGIRGGRPKKWFVYEIEGK